jgi:hypothetical protein
MTYEVVLYLVLGAAAGGFINGLSGTGGVSEALCMRLSPCSFAGSFIELFWV